MKTAAFFVNLLLYPFELLGAVIVWTFYGLGRTFLSPWGLLIPMSLCVAIVFALQLHNAPQAVLNQYEQELETCKAEEISKLFDALQRSGEKGLPSIVRKLGSPREPVFAKANEILNTTPPKHFEILSKHLLKNAPNFPPTGQTAAVKLTQKMLRELVALPKTDSNAHQATRNCEELLWTIETARKKINEPSGEFNPPLFDSVVQFNQKPQDSTLMAGIGKPFDDSPATASSDIDDSFAAARAERLYAYQRTGGRTGTSGGNVLIPSTEQEIAAASTIPAADSSLPTTPLAVPMAELNGKIASNYIERMTEQPSATVLPSSAAENVKLSGIPDLPTETLMRLLQHTDDKVVAEARKTLVGRDGFRDAHLKLAFRLFHQNAAVREEVLNLLPTTAGTQPNVWLSVLLNDPDANIRYRAASALATAGDPSMLRLVIDKGKRDSDARIIRLADQLQQQNKRY
jgi:hypothetical protein